MKRRDLIKLALGATVAGVLLPEVVKPSSGTTFSRGDGRWATPVEVSSGIAVHYEDGSVTYHTDPQSAFTASAESVQRCTIVFPTNGAYTINEVVNLSDVSVMAERAATLTFAGPIAI